MDQLFNYESIKKWIPYIFGGLNVTLLIALVAAIFGVTLGIMIVLAQKNKYTSKLAFIYIDIDTPN